MCTINIPIICRRICRSASTDRLCELNVIEQVINVCQTTAVQDAWDRGQQVTVHSWVYSLEDGLVRDLGLAVSDLESLTPQLDASLSRYQLDRQGG